MVARATNQTSGTPRISLARDLAAARQVLRGKTDLPQDPEEWGRQWPLKRGDATRLVRDEISYRAKQRAKA